MPQIRLLGLVLFITTVFLAMAAAATHTTHIRFKRPAARSQPDSLSEPPTTANPAEAPAQAPLVFPPRLPPPQSAPSQPPPPHMPSPWPASTAQAEPAPPESAVSYVSVPVVYPLLVSAAAGLAMWFVPAAGPSATSKRRRSRRRRR